MPKMVLLTPQELEERSLPIRQQRRRERERGIERYQEWLRDAKPGYGGEIDLSEEENKSFERLLLKEAAKRLGLNLQFRPLKNQQRIAFVVVTEPVRRGPPPRRRGAQSDGQEAEQPKPRRGRGKRSDS